MAIFFILIAVLSACKLMQKDNLENKVYILSGDYKQLFIIVDNNEYHCKLWPNENTKLYSYPANPI